MTSPFNDYAWGAAYEAMHETMYRMKDKDPSPSVARDEQLAVMWTTAYEAYQTTRRVSEMNAEIVSQLQEQLVTARENDDHEAEADLMQRLSDLEITAEDEAATAARLQRQIEWLEAIDAEYERRPWLSGDTTVDGWEINQDAVGWSEAR